MAEMKGTQLRAMMAFFRERFGEAALAEALARLEPADRNALNIKFLDSHWYPFDTLRPIRRLSRLLAPEGGLGLALEIGHAIANYTFQGVYRSLLEASPAAQVGKFEWIHGLFYRGSQTIETEMTGPSACLVRYRYFPGVSPARSTCGSMTGFWIRLLELSGGKKVQAAHPRCQLDGHDACEFTFRWE
jgi:hypothetical protein